jgi:hypothetical protein
MRHFYNPFTCEIVYYPSNEINNNFYSKRCKYFSDYNFCKNDYCHCKHLKDIELPIENDIADTLIERHTTINGEIGWKITKPLYDAMESTKPSYDAMESTKPAYDAMESTKPSYDAMESTKPSYDAMESTKPLYDAMESTKPSYDAMESTKPLYDAMEATKPSYDAMEATKPSYDAMEATKPLYDAMEAIKPLYLSYDLKKKQEIPVYPSMDPTYPSYEPTYPSYEPINIKPKLLPETTKVCCHYHKKYRPQKEMIKEYINDDKIIWICSVNNQCKIVTIM